MTRAATDAAPALAPERVAREFRCACVAELRAPKPGNVSSTVPGHGMTARDFIVSARVAAPALAAPAAGVGERILRAVQATRSAVGCNTNLGIVLLCAPLAHAVLRPRPGALRRRVEEVLGALDRGDAELAYRAIRLAAPGGLGAAPAHDVRDPPRVSLRQAMRAAADRDRIAHQYARGYPDVFDLGLPYLRAALARAVRLPWALASLSLAFLARFPDSHIVRRNGMPAAEEVMRRAGRLHAELAAQGAAPATVDAVREFDRELKRRDINPGTTADLAVATLFAWRLERALDAARVPRAAPAARSQGAHVSAHR